jgi:hypothetical protein
MRMPHNNNRVSTSGALATSDIWSKTIGHDPYANSSEARERTTLDEDQSKARGLLELARHQKIAGDTTSRDDDFSKKLYLGLKGGKKRRGDDVLKGIGYNQLSENATHSAMPLTDENHRRDSSSSSEEEEYLEEKVMVKKKSKHKKRHRKDDSSDDSSSSSSAEKKKKDKKRKRKSKKLQKTIRKSRKRYHNNSSDCDSLSATNVQYPDPPKKKSTKDGKRQNCEDILTKAMMSVIKHTQQPNK